MKGFAASGRFGVARKKKVTPRMRVTMNEVPHAIFTSGARSSERNVASASAADCSGTNGMDVPENRFGLVARGAQSLFDRVGDIGSRRRLAAGFAVIKSHRAAIRAPQSERRDADAAERAEQRGQRIASARSRAPTGTQSGGMKSCAACRWLNIFLAGCIARFLRLALVPPFFPGGRRLG